MPAKTIRTNLGICGTDDCEDCWVDMRVCVGCGRGPLSDDEDDCGECPRYCDFEVRRGSPHRGFYDTCGRKPADEVDGRPMCRHHAQQWRALLAGR